MRGKKNFTKDIMDSIDFTKLRGLGVVEKAPEKVSTRPPLVSVSRELVNSTIKDNYDKDQKQYTLFDLLEKPIQQRIEQEQERRLAVEYLHLSQGESRLISTLANLLYDQNRTDKSGNIVLEEHNKTIFPRGDQKKERTSPILSVKAQDLYKSYTGKVNPSGRDRLQIYETLLGLTSNRVFIWETKNDKGKQVIERDHIPYIFLKEIIPVEGLNEDERTRLRSNTLGSGDIPKIAEYKIYLNPVFISHWYVLRPRDLEERTVKLTGGGRISTAITRWRDYLMTFISSKKFETEIGEEKLIYKLGLEKKYKSRGANSEFIQTKIKEAIRVSTELKIIKTTRVEKGRLGERKYCFTLNKDFYNEYNDILEGESV